MPEEKNTPKFKKGDTVYLDGFTVHQLAHHIPLTVCKIKPKDGRPGWLVKCRIGWPIIGLYLPWLDTDWIAP